MSLDRERALFADTHPRIGIVLPEPDAVGSRSAAATDRQVEEYLHLYLLNRGVLITPFHNMALMCPATTPAQVERRTEQFGAAVEELYA